MVANKDINASQMETASTDLNNDPMTIVLDVKSREKVLIGTAVVTNNGQDTRLNIAGNCPVLREREVMKEEDATSPCKSLYFLIQCMYLSDNPIEYHKKFFEITREVRDAAPSCLFFIMQIGDQIMKGAYYKALMIARELVEHEKELMEIALSKAAE